MKKINLLFSMMLVFCLTAFSQFQLNTVPPLNGGNGSGGTVFQVSTNATIIVDSILQALQTTSQAPEIWYSATDTVGAPTVSTANGWTLVATSPTVTGVSAGLVPTLQTLPVGLNLLLQPGTYRFFVGCTSCSVIYTTWAAANQDVFSDAFITIKNGTNYGYGGAAPNPTFSPRQWNGGIKYTVLGGANDASVLSVDSPKVFCASSQSVVATIANFGINQIDSVDVNWEVNGVVQPVLRYAQLIDTLGGANPNVVKLNLGSAPFTAGSNTIKVFTSNPNGVMDTVNINDTALVTVITAAAPTNVTFTNVTLNSVEVTAVGGAGTIEYEYGPAGFTPGSGTTGSSPTPNFTIRALSQGTTYDVYVRSNCGAGDVSAYVGPVTFNTSYGVPYYEPFTSFAVGLQGNPFPNGWSSTTSVDPNWESESSTGANTNSAATGPFWDNTTFGTTGGLYMYFETSGGTVGDSADMVSPPIYIDTALSTVELSFAYFMHGANIDRLEVIADTNGVETVLTTIIGQQQAAQTDPWGTFSAFLNGYEGKSVTIKFRGFNVACCSGDIAIDDIKIDPVLPLNAGVVEVISPAGNLCPGTVTPIVGVKNFGSNVLDSVNVVFNVNGVIDSVKYVGTILPGNIAPVSLTALTVNSTTIYDIDFYTNLPNNMADQFNADDTLKLRGVRTGLSGNVTLDPALAGSATNLVSFAELEQVVNNYGVCGATVVTVAPGVYNATLALDNPPGMSSVNNLVIDGVDSSRTTITHDGSSNFATISIKGAEYITIRNMGINCTANDGAAILLNGDANYNIIENSSIWFNTSSTFFGSAAVAFSGSATDNTSNANCNYNKIQNNSITGGYYSVYMYGQIVGTDVGNKVLNNNIDSAYNYGVYSYYQDSVEINDNKIDAVVRGNLQADGIYAFYDPNAVIERNQVIANDYGMYIYNFTNVNVPSIKRKFRITNNMVSSATDWGIYMLYLDSVDFFNNSVVTEGSSNPAVQIFANTTNVIDDYDFRNNIMYSASTEAFEISGTTDSIFNKFDNNSYYSGGTNLININGTTYGTLAAYTTAQPLFNASSLDGDPQFLSLTDLHIVGAFVNDGGDNSVPILVDIDGDVRPSPGATNVDIGADEFDPPACPPVTNFIVRNITSTSADLDYDGAGNSYEYDVVLAGGTPSNGTVTALDSFTVAGLTPNTDYEAYVREICSRGDTSLWQIVAFETNCAAFTGPYTEGFESFVTDETPDCWKEYSTNFNALANIWVRSFTGTAGPSAGTQALYIYPYFGFTPGSDTLAAISPQFSDLTLGNKRITFDANTDDVVNVRMIVGTVDDPNSPTFTPMDTIVFGTNDVYANYTVNFITSNGYNGTDEFIYFAHDLANTGANFDYIRIDELELEDVPTCLKPTGLSSSNATLTSVDLDWVEINAATTWEVSYGTPGFTAGTGTQVVATAKPYTLGSLVGSTQYEFYVRSICSSTDTSAWEGPLRFGTANTVPYFNDFEGFTENRADLITSEGWSNFNSGNPKWQEDTLTTSGTTTGPAADHTIGAGGQFLFLETSTPGVAGDMDTLYSPYMLVPASAGALTMSFWYHMYGATIGSLEVYIDSSGTLLGLDTIVGQQQTAQLDPWRLDSLPINGSYNGQSIRFLFVGVRGTSFTGDLAIDDFSVDFTVGINKQLDELEGVSIFPNPSKGLFTLNINNNRSENYNMTVRDVNGKVVYEENLNVNGSYNESLDFTSYAKGVYYLQIQTENESRVEKLIIQ